ncbi:MAG: glycoside hydrolase [Bacteroidetes bacterium]|nr:MAG: glycoside hydrolase [Bacteroidota bacterium]
MNKGNPIIRDKFTADPTAIVKGGTVYLITGHDEAPIGTEKYVMHDWLCYSSTDMVNWTDHGSIFAATDFKWSDGHAYASNIIEHLGKYFFFAAVSHSTIPGAAIGVAISEDPTKKFKDARGSALITHNMLPPTDNTKANLDPSVLIDDDGSAYIFWGNKTCYFSKLTPNLIALDSSIQTINLPKFEEGAHIHKHNSWYYLLYGYGMPEKVAYAMSQNIYGPWEFKGIVNDIPRNCETNRPCIVDYKGKSYFIYHNGTLKNGGSHRRSVCIDYLHYNSDGTIQKVIMTTEGVNRD